MLPLYEEQARNACAHQAMETMFHALPLKDAELEKMLLDVVVLSITLNMEYLLDKKDFMNKCVAYLANYKEFIPDLHTAEIIQSKLGNARSKSFDVPFGIKGTKRRG